MARKKITLKQFENMDYEEFSELNAQQLVDVMKAVRSSIGKRVASLVKSSEYSYALENLVGPGYYTEDGVVHKDTRDPLARYKDMFSNDALNRMSENNQRNLAFAKLIQLSNFVHSKSSTLRGIKELNKEQDARIFGVDKKGRPLFRLDSIQRHAMWKLMEEFESKYSIGGAYTSNRMQNYFGTLVYEADLDFSNLDVNTLIDNAARAIAEENNLGEYHRGDFDKTIFTERRYG